MSCLASLWSLVLAPWLKICHVLALFSDAACLSYGLRFKTTSYTIWWDVKGPSSNVTLRYENSCRTWCGVDPAKLMLWMVCVSLGFLERQRLLGGNCSGAVLRGSVLCNLWCHHPQRERCSGRVHRWPTGLRVELQGGNELSMSCRVIDIFIIGIIVRLYVLSAFEGWIFADSFNQNSSCIRRLMLLFLPRPSWLYENILARTVFIKTLAFLNTCAKGT